MGLSLTDNENSSVQTVLYLMPSAKGEQYMNDVFLRSRGLVSIKGEAP